MLLIKTDTRLLEINADGEKYFDAILKMMLDERKPTAEGGIQKDPVKIALNGKAAEGEEEKEGYRGFLHLECSRCGRAKTFCAKEKMTVHRCCDCGKETELKDMRMAYTKCKCGQESYYLTNRTDAVLDIPCAHCGAPVSVMWNPNKKCYETIRG
ncbi:hypothetical protein [Anaerotignum sp.]